MSPTLARRALLTALFAIIAAFGGSSAHAQTILSFQYDKGGYLLPNDSRTVTVYLTSPVPAKDDHIRVYLDTAPRGYLTVPDHVDVLSGQQTASFKMTNVTGERDLDKIVLLQGRLWGQKTPFENNEFLQGIRITGVTLANAALQGGTKYTGMVTVDHAPVSGDIKVILGPTPYNPKFLNLPAEVTIAKRATSGTFNFSTQKVAAQQSDAIYAGYPVGKTIYDSQTVGSIAVTVSP